jgi:hypothetical protein
MDSGQTLDFIASYMKELAELAEKSGQPALAQVLKMAEIEARNKSILENKKTRMK